MLDFRFKIKHICARCIFIHFLLLNYFIFYFYFFTNSLTLFGNLEIKCTPTWVWFELETRNARSVGLSAEAYVSKSNKSSIELTMRFWKRYTFTLSKVFVSRQEINLKPISQRTNNELQFRASDSRSDVRISRTRARNDISNSIRNKLTKVFLQDGQTIKMPFYQISCQVHTAFMSPERK